MNRENQMEVNGIPAILLLIIIFLGIVDVIERMIRIVV